MLERVDPGASETTHPCKRCGAPIANRFAFEDCTRCALTALNESPEIRAWRESKRAAALERIAAMKAKQEDSDNE